MERLVVRKEYNCACWNGPQPMDTGKRCLMLMDALANYYDLGRTPDELTSDLTRLAEYDRQIKEGELVLVVRCKDCKLQDDINCLASHKVDGGYYTPRTIGGCLSGERR